MARDFDPEDKYSWFFGPIAREEANDILTQQKDSGVFLVRESQSIRGDFVLCVREDNKVSHYIINRIQVGGAIRFRIGDQEFPDLPSLLNFYKTHYLDSTPLIRPAPRERVIAKYDFPGSDREDLPFRRGEVLEVIIKDEEKWWTARNANRQVGQIPVPYVQRMDEAQPAQNAGQGNYRQPENQQLRQAGPDISKIKLPARAEVVQQRIPNVYDTRQLKLEVGEIVTVTKVNVNGMWEGEVNGRSGIFPFIHVKLLEQDGTIANSHS